MLSKWSLAILRKEALSLEDEMRLDKLRKDWCRVCYEEGDWTKYPCDRCAEDWIKPVPERPAHYIHPDSRQTGD